jgi:hypothetical protein
VDPLVDIGVSIILIAMTVAVLLSFLALLIRYLRLLYQQHQRSQQIKKMRKLMSSLNMNESPSTYPLKLPDHNLPSDDHVSRSPAASMALIDDNGVEMT